MGIDLEKIDLLRNRANVSYEEAKTALEKSDNDLVEALILLEKDNKTKPDKKKESETFVNNATSFIKDIIEKGNETRLIIKKEERNIVNLSLTVTVIGSIVAPVIPLAGIPLALITRHKIRIEKKNGEDMKVNKVFDKVSSSVNSIMDGTEKDPKEDL
ncbi:protein of unknown function [Natronincola peptidivorans]|uniref:DUF4342 domain-containing protein n=1 Tax=Natronincola peptidivorans TaxID=426128 RepID=A0A1I0ATI4_9FIRM|nr:DUF4342 domain-containing protein [Natronincola peptidivorans]SES97218.1 protein of unknown function [Natronincola peptidivorans]